MDLENIDPYYLRNISLLFTDKGKVGKKLALQVRLEAAIKEKTGATVDFTPLLAETHNEKVKTTHTDKELIEDLKACRSVASCKICKSLKSDEEDFFLCCCGCRSFFHFKCYRPTVSLASLDCWMCSLCVLSKSYDYNV